MESNYEKEMNKRNEKILYEKEMNKRNEKIPYEKEMNKRNEKIPDPQNCLGGAAINQYPQIVLGGGGKGGGDPYTNQHPTLRKTPNHCCTSSDEHVAAKTVPKHPEYCSSNDLQV